MIGGLTLDAALTILCLRRLGVVRRLQTGQAARFVPFLHSCLRFYTSLQSLTLIGLGVIFMEGISQSENLAD